MARDLFKPFTKRDEAAFSAQILERMTGEACRVSMYGRNLYIILRQTPNGLIRG